MNQMHSFQKIIRKKQIIVKPKYKIIISKINLFILGSVFSYGSSCSICNNCIPPICKVGRIAIASTIIPIPPNHCNNDRQISIPSDKLSNLI